MEAWNVECSQTTISGLPGHLSPMVELDLVRRRLRLAVGTPNAMDSAETTGALIRRYLEGDSVDGQLPMSGHGRNVPSSSHRRGHDSRDDVVRRHGGPLTEDAAAAADAFFEGIGGAADASLRYGDFVGVGGGMARPPTARE